MIGICYLCGLMVKVLNFMEEGLGFDPHMGKNVFYMFIVNFHRGVPIGINNAV